MMSRYYLKSNPFILLVYRKSSIKRRGAYSKLDFLDAALNRGRRLFEGGAYSKTASFCKYTSSFLKDIWHFSSQLMERKTNYSLFELDEITLDNKNWPIIRRKSNMMWPSVNNKPRLN